MFSKDLALYHCITWYDLKILQKKKKIRTVHEPQPCNQRRNEQCTKWVPVSRSKLTRIVRNLSAILKTAVSRVTAEKILLEIFYYHLSGIFLNFGHWWRAGKWNESTQERTMRPLFSPILTLPHHLSCISYDWQEIKKGGNFFSLSYQTL